MIRFAEEEGKRDHWCLGVLPFVASRAIQMRSIYMDLGHGDGVGKSPPPIPSNLGTTLPLDLGGRGEGAKVESGATRALEVKGEPGEEDKDGEEDGEGMRPLQEDGSIGEGGGAGRRHR